MVNMNFIKIQTQWLDTK